MNDLWEGMMKAVLDESDRTVLKMLLEKDMTTDEIRVDRRTKNVKTERALGWLEENVLVRFKDGRWCVTSEGKNFSKFNNHP